MYFTVKPNEDCQSFVVDGKTFYCKNEEKRIKRRSNQYKESNAQIVAPLKDFRPDNRNWGLILPRLRKSIKRFDPFKTVGNIWPQPKHVTITYYSPSLPSSFNNQLIKREKWHSPQPWEVFLQTHGSKKKWKNLSPTTNVSRRVSAQKSPCNTDLRRQLLTAVQDSGRSSPLSPKQLTVMLKESTMVSSSFKPQH